jgi:hypothetical protein
MSAEPWPILPEIRVECADDGESLGTVFRVFVVKTAACLPGLPIIPVIGIAARVFQDAR